MYPDPPSEVYNVNKLDLCAQPFFSVAQQLNLTRFEFRLVKFFNDSCIPLFTFNINERADYLWRFHLPQLFASLDIVRQSVYSFACLNLWPFVDLSQVLDQDKSLEVGAAFNSTDYQGLSINTRNFSHVFNTLSVFDDGQDSIFLKTAHYFSGAVLSNNDIINSMLSSPELEKTSLLSLFLSSSLVFAFLGLHPQSVVPLLQTDSESSTTDLLGLACSMRDMFLTSTIDFRGTPVGQLNDDFLVAPSVVYKRRSVLVAELRTQLNDYYRTTASFLEIDSTISSEYDTLGQALAVLERCVNLSILQNYPIPLFRALFLLPPRFGEMSRAKHPFALRILYVYSCAVIFCGFHILRDENVWNEFVLWYVGDHSPLCHFDDALFQFVVVQRREINWNHFADSLEEFDGLAATFAILPLFIADTCEADAADVS